MASNRSLYAVALSAALGTFAHVTLSGQALKKTNLAPGNGKKVVVAVRATAPIRLDGVLEEPDWQRAEPAIGFVQREPHEGKPATEETEIRVLFDGEALYFGVNAFESEPARIMSNSLERDFEIDESDGVSFYLDTFNDSRNGFAFFINPSGSRHETQFVNEGRDVNRSWEDVWYVKTRRGSDGWHAEVKIPFKSLRFPKSETQVWGINFQRRIRRKNEQSFWSPLPRRYTGYYVSVAGLLKGIEIGNRGRNFKVKPYTSAEFRSLASDDFDTRGRLGLDVKYGLIPGLTLDATVNTDFSQVEVDEQQINLTRFSLFFPEKRDFFLENAGIFVFGQTDQGSGARPRDRDRERDRDIIPFFSRRIGLSPAGQPLPIAGGVRLTGHLDKYGLGLLNIQARESGSEPANNFTVVRVKRDIFAYSDIGALFVSRQSNRPDNYNRTFGVDSNFRFWQNLRINSFLAASRTPGLERDDMARRIWVEWRTNTWEARSGYLDVGRNFNAEVGFVPRRGVHKSDSSAGLRHRPAGSRWIREFNPNASLQYTTDSDNGLLTRISNFEFKTEFQDGGSLSVGRTLNFERLDDPFVIHRPITIARGDYNFDLWYAELRSDPSRRLSGSLRYDTGDFWDGERQGWQFGISLKPYEKFTASGRYSQDRVRLRGGSFLTRLVNMRLNYSFNTRMFLNALIQYNSDLRKVSSNLRFRLIHRPLSDIFVVYNEQRDAFSGGLADKSLSVKYTHMLDLF